MFKPILKKTKKVMDIGCAVGIRVLTYKANKFANKIGADSIIPFRYRTSLSKTKGYYRRKCAKTFQRKDTTGDPSLKQ